MSSKVYDKEWVEAIPLGEPRVAIVGFYLEREQTQKLLNAIFTVFKIAIEELGIPSCGILRLVEVASDFATEVARWRRQLGEPGGISSNSKAETWGKTLPLWGSGEPESTYAVIILPREIAYCLIAGENSLKSLARGILVHELAHVHDNYRYRRDLPAARTYD